MHKKYGYYTLAGCLLYASEVAQFYIVVPRVTLKDKFIKRVNHVDGSSCYHGITSLAYEFTGNPPDMYNGCVPVALTTNVDPIELVEALAASQKT